MQDQMQGLWINIPKTETMILNHMLLENKYPDTIISLWNVPLQNFTGFKYLGLYISQNEHNMGYIKTNHHILMVHTKFANMTNLLQNEIHLKTKVKFLNSFVHSWFTCSCKNWNLTVGQFEKLDIAYHNLLKRMIRGGFKRIGDNNGDFG